MLDLGNDRMVPEHGYQVDWSHPLAPAGGWGAFPGLGFDFFGQPGTLTTAAGYGSSLHGRAMVASSATTGGIQFPFPAHLKNATAALTLVTLTAIEGLNANNNILLVIRDNTTEASPFLIAGMWESANTGGSADVGIRDQGGTFRQIGAGGGSGVIASVFATGNGMRMYAVTIAPPNVALYINGSLAATATLGAGTGISYSTTPPGIAVGGYGTNTTTQGVLGASALALIYPRALTAAQISTLWANPACYAMGD